MAFLEAPIISAELMAELANLLQLLVSLYRITPIKLLTKAFFLAELLSDSDIQKYKTINMLETDLKIRS